MKRTGTGGGKEMMMNDIDEAVLQIIGKESPVVAGLHVEESQVEENINPSPTVFDSISNKNYTVLTSNSSRQLQQSSSNSMMDLLLQPTPATKQTTKRKIETSEKEDLIVQCLRLKKKKLELEVRILRQQLNDSDSDTL